MHEKSAEVLYQIIDKAFGVHPAAVLDFAPCQCNTRFQYVRSSILLSRAWVGAKNQQAFLEAASALLLARLSQVEHKR